MTTTPLVYSAIGNVMADLAAIGIAKDQKNSSQGFMFRGIDAVYSALSPILSKHGLCILPRVLDRESVERASKNGGTLFSVTLRVAFDFVAKEDGSRHEIITCGEGMDSGDKATSKAMSAAYKYAAFQAFCIPVEGESPDADQETHEVAGRGTTTKAPAKAAQKPAAAPATSAPASGKPADATDAGDPMKDWTLKLVTRMEGISTEGARMELSANPNVGTNRTKIEAARADLKALILDAERAMLERVGKNSADQNWVDNEIPGGRAAA